MKKETIDTIYDFIEQMDNVRLQFKAELDSSWSNSSGKIVHNFGYREFIANIYFGEDEYNPNACFAIKFNLYNIDKKSGTKIGKSYIEILNDYKSVLMKYLLRYEEDLIIEEKIDKIKNDKNDKIRKLQENSKKIAKIRFENWEKGYKLDDKGNIVIKALLSEKVGEQDE